MTTVESCVLITTEAGVADYVTLGSVHVVNVDWDYFSRRNVNEVLPNEVRDKIKELKQLPDNMPWRNETVKRLNTFLIFLEENAGT